MVTTQKKNVASGTKLPFIRSNMYLVSYRGSTQLRDSESESLILTSSYVIFFPKNSQISSCNPEKQSSRKVHSLVAVYMGDVPEQGSA